MESFYFNRIKELKKEIDELERKLQVVITITGKKVEIEGSAVNEYEAGIILEAMQFGFSSKKALLLLNDDIIFKKVPIRSFTRRKDMKEVRGRVIGKQGKTKSTLEEISGCDILVNEEQNQIGIIGSALEMDEATAAIEKLIRGSKQANVYRYLERMNAEKKKMDSDLGLKLKKKEEKKYSEE